MNVNERIPKQPHPKLFDRLIGELQDILADELDWLDHSFGRAERLVKIINGKRYYSPNLYTGDNHYKLISPDKWLGNYSFFVLNEPESVDWHIGEQNIITTPFSLIVWLDIRSIDQEDERNTEAAKQQILRAINSNVRRPREGRVTINRIYERAENVFEGFTLDEVDNQFLMQPYCGFRFDGIMEIEDECVII